MGLLSHSGGQGGVLQQAPVLWVSGAQPPGVPGAPGSLLEPGVTFWRPRGLQPKQHACVHAQGRRYCPVSKMLLMMSLQRRTDAKDINFLPSAVSPASAAPASWPGPLAVLSLISRMSRTWRWPEGLLGEGAYAGAAQGGLAEGHTHWTQAPPQKPEVLRSSTSPLPWVLCAP